jgi:hypothetical protein
MVVCTQLLWQRRGVEYSARRRNEDEIGLGPGLLAPAIRIVFGDDNDIMKLEAEDVDTNSDKTGLNFIS